MGWEKSYADWKDQAKRSKGGKAKGTDIHVVVGGDMAAAQHFTEGQITAPDGSTKDIKLRETSVFRKEGVHMGGNVQHGAFVLGGEISVSGGEIDGSKGPDCFSDDRDDSFECKKEDKWLMLAMGRLGYAPDNWMAYVTGGAAVVGFQTDTVDDGDPETAGADTDLGWAVGGGVEVEVMPNVIAGVEYIHAEFDGATDSEDVLTWEQDMDLIRGRLSYKFAGFGCCEAAPAAAPFK